MSELLHVLKTLTESVSDNSDVEQGIMTAEITKRPTRKRKWEVATGNSGIGYSGSCSPIVIPLGSVGFLRKGSESNDENGDPSDSEGSSRTRVKGYDTATTAVVTDSEDDLFFLEESRFTAEDQFALEYEPPATDDGGDDDDDDDEGSLSLHTSDDSEDPGAEGGDEFDEDEDDTDSEIDEDEMWSCSSCLTKNHPMTRHCTGCWCRRCEWLPPGLTRSSSAPVPRRRGVVVSSQSLSRSNSLCASPSIEPVNNLGTQSTCTCPICMAVNFVPPVVDNKSDDHNASGADFVNVLSSGAHNSHIGIASQLFKLERTNHHDGTDSKDKFSGKDCKETVDSSLDLDSTSASLLTHSQSEKCTTTSRSAKDDNEEQRDTLNTADQSKSQTDVCIICLSQPRNASFVHGHTGHQVCCIECADKMKATKKRCPVCRKKIQLVVKNFL